MVQGEVEGRMSRLLASLATKSNSSTVYLLPLFNPVSGMRASGSGGRGGGTEERTTRMMISPCLFFYNANWIIRAHCWQCWSSRWARRLQLCGERWRG